MVNFRYVAGGKYIPIARSDEIDHVDLLTSCLLSVIANVVKKLCLMDTSLGMNNHFIIKHPKSFVMRHGDLLPRIEFL